MGDGDWEWVYAGLRFDLAGEQPPEVTAAALAALQGLPPHRLAEALLPLPGQEAAGGLPPPPGYRQDILQPPDDVLRRIRPTTSQIIVLHAAVHIFVDENGLCICTKIDYLDEPALPASIHTWTERSDCPIQSRGKSASPLCFVIHCRTFTSLNVSTMAQCRTFQLWLSAQPHSSKSCLMGQPNFVGGSRHPYCSMIAVSWAGLGYTNENDAHRSGEG